MKYYWTTKTGEKIDVDEMTTQHLRNVLKMIMRNNAKKDRLVLHALNDSNIRKSFRESEIEDMYRDIDYYDL